MAVLPVLEGRLAGASGRSVGVASSASSCFLRPAASCSPARDVPACSTSSRACDWRSCRSAYLCGAPDVAALLRAGGPLASSRRQVARGSSSVVTRASSAYQPFPFDETDYYKAHLQLVQSTDPTGISAGNLVFMKEGETVYDRDKRALVLSVGGDTLAGIAALVQGRQHERPMSLDLLWQILGRGQDVSKRDWRLLRVAIVALKHDVYYGRLFFGDADTGGVVWDCDCRPSDACWLSLKAGCPVFIRREVWDEHAVRLADLASSEEGGGGGGGTAAAYAEAAEAEEEDSGTAVLTKIRKSDPDPIKRLKREMEVALREEDYATAARIRDHPFMRLHVEIVRARREGNDAEALELELRLERAISDADQAKGVL